MAKKPVVRELTASERGNLSKKINQCADEQLKSEHHGGLAAALKKEIRATMESGGLPLHETEIAFARIDEKDSRKFDEDAVEKIRKMVDPADFEVICPRKVDLKAFDEVIGHHRYPALEKVPTISTSRALVIGQLAG